MQFIRSLKEIYRKDQDLGGERAVDLAVLSEKGYSVPLSFVVTNYAFETFVSENGLQTRIGEILNGNDPNTIYETIRELILNAKMPHEMIAEIVEGYESLNIDEDAPLHEIVKAGDVPVVTLIISPNYTVPENNEGIILNVKGLDELITALRECWACLFTPSMQRYRKEAGIDEHHLNVGVIIERITPGKITAEAWSATNGNTDELTVLSYYGNLDIAGDIEKDEFKLSREYLLPTYQSVGMQSLMLALDEEDKLGKVALGRRGEEQKITDRENIELGRLAKKGSLVLDKHVRLFFDVNEKTIKTILCTRLLLTKGSMKLQSYEPEERIEDPERVVETEEAVIAVDEETGESEVIAQHEEVLEAPVEEPPQIDEVETLEEPVEEMPEILNEAPVTEGEQEVVNASEAQSADALESSTEAVSEERTDVTEESQEYEEPEAPVEVSGEHATEEAEESIFSSIVEEDPPEQIIADAPATADEAYNKIVAALRNRYEGRFHNTPPVSDLSVFEELCNEIIVPHEDRIRAILTTFEETEQVNEEIQDILEDFLEKFV